MNSRERKFCIFHNLEKMEFVAKRNTKSSICWMITCGLRNIRSKWKNKFFRNLLFVNKRPIRFATIRTFWQSLIIRFNNLNVWFCRVTHCAHICTFLYFVICTKISTVNNLDGSVRINRTTKVTGKGQQYFINKFLIKQERRAVIC